MRLNIILMVGSRSMVHNESELQHKVRSPMKRLQLRPPEIGAFSTPSLHAMLLDLSDVYSGEQ